MLALCSMLLPSYYAQNYAGIIGSSLAVAFAGINCCYCNHSNQLATIQLQPLLAEGFTLAGGIAAIWLKLLEPSAALQLQSLQLLQLQLIMATVSTIMLISCYSCSHYLLQLQPLAAIQLHPPPLAVVSVIIIQLLQLQPLAAVVLVVTVAIIIATVQLQKLAAMYSYHYHQLQF